VISFQEGCNKDEEERVRKNQFHFSVYSIRGGIGKDKRKRKKRSREKESPAADKYAIAPSRSGHGERALSGDP